MRACPHIRTLAASCLFVVLAGGFSSCSSQTDNANESNGNSGGIGSSKGTESKPSGGASAKKGEDLGSPTTTSGTTQTPDGNALAGAAGSAPLGEGIVLSGGMGGAANNQANVAGSGSAVASTGGNAPSPSDGGNANPGTIASTSGKASTGGNLSTGGTPANTGGTTAAISTAPAALCDTFPTKPTITGALFEGATGISGIVASRKQPGVYFIHSDRQKNLFAIDSTGKLLGTWEMTSASSRYFWIYNWEDISIQSMPSGPDRIWIGDIGNNFVREEEAKTDAGTREPRTYLKLMSINEPTIDPAQPITGTIQLIDELQYTYPDGLHDSEAMTVDPLTGDAYVITKEETSPSKIYRAAAPLVGGVLEYVGSFDSTNVNGADFSPSGRELLIRNYSYVYYWALPAGKSWRETLGSDPTVPNKKTRLTYTENYYGEAIGFSADETGFYVVSEEKEGAPPAPVEFYPKSCK